MLLELPQSGYIESCTRHPLPVLLAETEFSIDPSSTTGSNTMSLAADSSVCPDCLWEMNDPQNRRFHYPFITCTQCGPRYTIVKQLPYDRPRTTMACFAMCPECANEYTDPRNRRFHAQPIACPRCGPRTWLVPTGWLISGPGCPVCVTPVEYIDHALALSRLPDVTLASFGDLIRVPGSTAPEYQDDFPCLATARARGADVRLVYSPLDALRLAVENGHRQVIFLGVGFETNSAVCVRALRQRLFTGEPAGSLHG